MTKQALRLLGCSYIPKIDFFFFLHNSHEKHTITTNDNYNNQI